MVEFISFKFLMIVLIGISELIYNLLLYSYLKLYFKNKFADYLMIFVWVFGVFFFKFILFKKQSFWSDIFPFYLVILLVLKFYILKYFLSSPLLIFTIILSSIYPICYGLNIVELDLNPYFVFIYHLFWIGIFIFCSKKISSKNDILKKSDN